MQRAFVPAAVTLVGFVGLGVVLVFLRPWSSGDQQAPPLGRAALAPPTPSTREPAVVVTQRARLRVVMLTNALLQPWALALLPDGDILITEREGRLRLIHEGSLLSGSIDGIPPVDTRKQDGLMDIALHPRFAQNRALYFTYSKPGERGDTTTLATARFDEGRLTNVRDLFVADAWSTAGGNSGSRLAFGSDGTIYMTVGERHEQTPAQDLRSHKGKILRLNDDGTVPPDNPFVGRSDARPEIFAYGVRNPQGLFVEPSTGAIWEHEHGPRGGDELNTITRGHNYGWPAITFGINYDGTTISKSTARAGMDQPVAYWVPSISPSGLTVYAGDRFPAWRGNVLLGALGGQHLRRLELTNGRVTNQEEILLSSRPRRIRDVREGPDGLLYVLTDAGALLRVEPAP